MTTAAASVLAGWACIVATARDGSADPLFEPPMLGRKATTGGGPGDAVTAGLVLEARLVGPLGADRLALWPDRSLGLEAREPGAVALRAGAVLWLRGAPVGFVVQLDLAEIVRPGRGGDGAWAQDFGPFATSLVDDLYATWRPSRSLQLVAGRARVPLTRQRQWDERDLPLGAAPQVVDRIAPDRRFGLLVHGDLGALAYAAGLWSDDDALELRALGDASAGGRLLAGGHLEWTPIAPMYGSNPVGAVVGARGPLPTPRRDPWYPIHRLSLGAAVLARRSAAGDLRTDLSLSAGWKWRWLGAEAEVIRSAPANGKSELGAWLELHATPVTDKLSWSVRAEWDEGASPDGTATAGGGITWHATDDRRSKIGLVGWLRFVGEGRDGRDRREDALVVVIQTAL
jgi:hypothetical protein